MRSERTDEYNATVIGTNGLGSENTNHAFAVMSAELNACKARQTGGERLSGSKLAELAREGAADRIEMIMRTSYSGITGAGLGMYIGNVV